MEIDLGVVNLIPRNLQSWNRGLRAIYKELELRV